MFSKFISITCVITIAHDNSGLKTVGLIVNTGEQLKMAKGRSSDSYKTSNDKIGLRKKSIPGPTTPVDFFGMIVMKIAKKILLVDTHVKIGFYCVVVMVASVICDLFHPPMFYLGSKNSVFNVYFVKIGWGWTLALCGSFIFLTSYTYCCGHLNLVCRHLARLAVGTVEWWVWVNLFNTVEHASGFCTKDGHDSKTLCLNSGHLWLGFDISGHTFLLLHCLLTISEECKCLRHWERVVDNFKTDDERKMPNQLPAQDLCQLKVSYYSLGPFIKLNAALLSFLMVLWEMMLLITALYYHTLIQKFIGASIAIGTWFVTYQVWYKCSWSPGLPGHGVIDVA